MIAPDLLGSGANPPWPDEKLFDLSEDVDAIEALVERLGEPVHLVGHSYGGLLALKLARRDPSRIRSLTAYDPVAFGVLHAANDAEGLADLARAGRTPCLPTSLTEATTPGSRSSWTTGTAPAPGGA